MMEVVFQDVISHMKQEGRTVLLSSHILAQVGKLADRISIIRQGRVVQTGTLTVMRHLTLTMIEAHTIDPAVGTETLPGINDREISNNRDRFAVHVKHLDGVVRRVSGFGLAAGHDRAAVLLRECAVQDYRDR